MARNSWCYTENNDYKTAREIICDLVDIVSKNGTMLLNIGPKADGTIPDEDKKILLDIGRWLKVNGEAIYNSKVWRVAQEGPTGIEEGQFTDGKTKVFTSEDIRFTVNGSSIYATVLNYPEDGRVNIKSFAYSRPYFSGIIKDISVLGFDEKPVWERNGEALSISTKNVKSDMPVVFKITLE